MMKRKLQVYRINIRAYAPDITHHLNTLHTCTHWWIFLVYIVYLLAIVRTRLRNTYPPQRDITSFSLNFSFAFFFLVAVTIQSGCGFLFAQNSYHMMYILCIYEQAESSFGYCWTHVLKNRGIAQRRPRARATKRRSFGNSIYNILLYIVAVDWNLILA